MGDCDSFNEFDIYQGLVIGWYTIIMVLNLFLIIFTMVKARLKAKEMDEAFGSLYDEYENDGYNDIDNYSMYQKMPEEYSDKRRQSEPASEELDVIDEDDEERDYFPSPSSSIHTENDTNIEAQKTPDYFTFRRTSLERQYPRSNSTAECYPSRNSLVPVKSSLKRTESQNRADYLIKVRLNNQGKKK